MLQEQDWQQTASAAVDLETAILRDKLAFETSRSHALHLDLQDAQFDVDRLTRCLDALQTKMAHRLGVDEATRIVSEVETEVNSPPPTPKKNEGSRETFL
jgi:hypothetical protein